LSAAIKGRYQFLQSITSQLLRCGLRSKSILDTLLVERFQTKWTGLVGCRKVSDRLCSPTVKVKWVGSLFGRSRIAALPGMLPTIQWRRFAAPSNWARAL